MPPVFAHGRLRLYLLKLLDEAPRHGYEVIRLLEERFQGLYAPSAGTVYPPPRQARGRGPGHPHHRGRPQGLLHHRRRAGRTRRPRGGELADLELEIRDSLAALAADIQEDVRGGAEDLRRQMREAATQTRTDPGGDYLAGAKEELRKAKEEWMEQARRAKEESRRARQDAQTARRQARKAQENAREEVRRITERVQQEVREHAQHGDWPTGIVEGVSTLAQELGALVGRGPAASAPAPTITVERADDILSKDPARDLDRLLDRFRDGVRDAARDHGVTAHQLAEIRTHLTETAARVSEALRAHP
ncbi:PadR family transcriptional regulator [Streptomyces olivoverticillatus]